MSGDKPEDGSEEEVLTACMHFVEWINGEFNADAEITKETETDPEKIHIHVPGQGHLHVDRKTGEVETKIVGKIPEKLREALGQKPTPTQDQVIKSLARVAANSDRLMPRDMPVRDIQVAELTLEDIKGYICPSATDEEAFMFLKLCQARNLNPFTNEAYLIKYGQKAQMVVGKEAFMRKAELHPQYGGFKAGIITENDEGLVYREGSFLRKGEELLGGWAEVYRKDRDHPIRAEVALKDYDSGKEGPWKSHKATMIRKVPLVQALREAFPNDLSGCYDASELKEAPTYIEYELVEA